MPRSKYTARQKWEMLVALQGSKMSLHAFAVAKGVDYKTLQRWQEAYAHEGLEGLSEATHNRHYSEAVKQAAVRAYRAGEGTLAQVAERFEIRSPQQLHNWIVKYDREGHLAATPTRKPEPTHKRKVSLEKRIQVVEYVTRDKHSYMEAAEKFNVSYQQARLWTLKSCQNGYEALDDRRGWRRAGSRLSTNDRLRLEVRQLHARLQAELKDRKTIEKFATNLMALQREEHRQQGK